MKTLEEKVDEILNLTEQKKTSERVDDKGNKLLKGTGIKSVKIRYQGQLHLAKKYKGKWCFVEWDHNWRYFAKQNDVEVV